MTGQPLPPLVTLTTDFGTQDPYVAAVKGVLHRECPGVRIEDLSHEVGPQNLIECALFVAGAAPWFPGGTIHLVVVDPGVGSSRTPIAVQAGGHHFVCPDNGLLSLYLAGYPEAEARTIANPAFMLPEVSATFHGRDIFAACAARLAAGVSFEEVGPVAEQLVSLALPRPRAEEDGRIQGVVIHVDHFGNCITNIRRDDLRENAPYRVQFGGRALPGIYAHYAAARPNQPLALFGSTGYLEIAVREGDANQGFGLDPGEPITLYLP